MSGWVARHAWRYVGKTQHYDVHKCSACEYEIIVARGVKPWHDKAGCWGSAAKREWCQKQVGLRSMGLPYEDWSGQQGGRGGA
jgi:hypothetical protein